MSLYLIIGIVFYAVLSMLRSHTFKNASLLAVIRGLVFGILLWPLAIVFMLYVFKSVWLNLIGFRAKK